MKLTRLILSNFQQFKYLDLDLTYPEGHEKAGEPLEKVCFIGKNGTGKSTILRMIQDAHPKTTFNSHEGISIFQFVLGGKKYLSGQLNKTLFLGESQKDHLEIINTQIKQGQTLPENTLDLIPGPDGTALLTSPHEIINFMNRMENELLIFSTSESESNPLLKTGPFPNVKSSESEKYFSIRPHEYQISFDRINEFWSLLIYILRQRESDRNDFENLPENLDKTKAELIKEFDQKHPDFLPILAKLWDEILEGPGLYMDYKNAKAPVHSSDNLTIRIKLKENNSTLPISKLSTGIRNLIFRLGYFAAIFHVERGKEATVLIDEPENDLFPDLQYKLVDLYQQASENAQLFFATHSPIIAAQFDPAERFILDFDENGYVTARRGKAAEGDDPNDLLIQDFEVESVMGKKGKEMWERFVELKVKISQESDKSKRNKLLKEYFEIGEAYNFMVNEKGEQVFGF